MTLPTAEELSANICPVGIPKEQERHLIRLLDMVAYDAYRAVAKELRELIADRACQDFITLKAEVEKIAEQLESEKVAKASAGQGMPAYMRRRKQRLEGEKVTR